MRKKFSSSWKASKQPRKQRKYLANAPIHIKRKFMSANLDKELRKKLNMKNIEIRKSDEVKVMRGKFKKKTGKISEVDIKRCRVCIEGIQRTKKDGGKLKVWFHPSKLKIINLNLEDKYRKKTKEKNAPEKK